MQSDPYMNRKVVDLRSDDASLSVDSIVRMVCPGRHI
jgi:hypothetical protein